MQLWVYMDTQAQGAIHHHPIHEGNGGQGGMGDCLGPHGTAVQPCSSKKRNLHVIGTAHAVPTVLVGPASDRCAVAALAWTSMTATPPLRPVPDLSEQ